MTKKENILLEIFKYLNMVFGAEPFKSLVNSFSFDKFTLIQYNLKVPENKLPNVLHILSLHEEIASKKVSLFEGPCVILRLQIIYKHV